MMGYDMNRSPGCLAKLDRMNKTLRHEEADRVPVSDFFWGSFLDRWRRELGLAGQTDIYKYYDLDWIVTVPNMDPHIKQFEMLEESGEHVVLRTGFEAVIKKQFADPMPAFLRFETDTVEKMDSFQFDDPWDARRYFNAGDNQIAGVGDGFARNSAAWLETVKSLHPDFPVYGSVCEGQEMLWRIIGSENVMLWIGLYPDELARFIERIGEFALGITKAQIKASGGRAGWDGYLGRCCLHQGYVLFTRLLATMLQARCQSDCRGMPLERTSGHLSRMRKRQEDLSGFH